MMARKVQVVVIAPVGVTVSVKAACDYSTLVFSSVAEFERWRVDASRSVPSTIAAVVRRALMLSSISTDRTRPAIDWLSSRSSVPTVKQLAAAWSSRRSFFRTWKADMPMSPQEFLRLVRCLHAEELLGRGVDEKEAAEMSGFGTVGVMRRALAHRQGSNGNGS